MDSLSATETPITSILILGTSRFSEEVADWVEAIPGFKLDGFIENLKPDKCGNTIGGKPVHWIDDLSQVGRGCHLLCGLGTTLRSGYIDQAKRFGLPFATLVHPVSHLATNCRIGAGSLIGPGAMVAARALVGDHVLINKGAIVGHHARIGYGATIGMGARLAGGCDIGPSAHIAMGALVLDGLRVGSSAVVAAGSIVTHDVPDHAQVMGAPARIVKDDVRGL